MIDTAELEKAVKRAAILTLRDPAFAPVFDVLQQALEDRRRRDQNSAVVRAAAFLQTTE